MTELMSSGVELMLTGMGIVFLFLAMLVAAINMMSSLVQRFFPDAQALAVAAPVVPAGIDKSIVAAITAAVHQHRNTHR